MRESETGRDRGDRAPSWKAVGLAALTLGISTGAPAQTPTQGAMNAVYFGGQNIVFQSYPFFMADVAELWAHSVRWASPGAHVGWRLDFREYPGMGGRGAVVFNGVPFCFFTTADAKQ